MTVKPVRLPRRTFIASLSAAGLAWRPAEAHPPYNPRDEPPDDVPQEVGPWYDPGNTLPQPLPTIAKAAAAMSAFGVGVAGTITGAGVSQVDSPLPGPFDGLGAMVVGAAGLVASALFDFALDPPQANYKHIATPVVPPFSTFKHANILSVPDRGLVEDTLALYARVVALIDAFERQQYAASVGDTNWVSIHQGSREGLAQDLASRAQALLDLAARALEIFDDAPVDQSAVLAAPPPSASGLTTSASPYANEVYDDLLAFALQRPLSLQCVDFHTALAGYTMHGIRHEAGRAYLHMLESVAAQQDPQNWLLKL